MTIAGHGGGRFLKKLPLAGGETHSEKVAGDFVAAAPLTFFAAAAA